MKAPSRCHLDEDRRPGQRRRTASTAGCAARRAPTADHAPLARRERDQAGPPRRGSAVIGFSTRHVHALARESIRAISRARLVGVATTTAASASGDLPRVPTASVSPNSRATSSARPSWWSWTPDDLDAGKRRRDAGVVASEVANTRPRPGRTDCRDVSSGQLTRWKPRSLDWMNRTRYSTSGCRPKLLLDPFEGLAAC